jgi:hypothetical protein
MQYIELSKLQNNSGQLDGVHENPRDLTEKGFEQTKKSIQEFPDMLEVRMLVVVPHNDNYVVVGGNQRLRALNALGYNKAPCIVVNWDADKINQFIVADNLSFGSWNYDLLANEWDVEDLNDWGMELPFNLEDAESEDFQVKEKSSKMFGLKIETEIKTNFEQIKQELDRLKIGYNEYEK